MSIKNRIVYLRKALAIHSYIYYTLGESIIDDDRWDALAYELVKLQKDIWQVGYYDRIFHDFDGSTGMHLPKDEWIINKANSLLKTHKEMK